MAFTSSLLSFSRYSGRHGCRRSQFVSPFTINNDQISYGKLSAFLICNGRSASPLHSLCTQSSVKTNRFSSNRFATSLSQQYPNKRISSTIRAKLSNIFRSKTQFHSNLCRQLTLFSSYKSTNNQSLNEDSETNPSSTSNAPPFMKLSIDTPEDMEDVGSVLSIGSRKGDILFLDGDLGAGKTCFSRGFIRAKTGLFDMKVTSPTYLLSNTYDGFDDITVHHMDLYRLSGSKVDFEPLNLPLVFTECISLIEWPVRLGSLTPDVRLDVTIQICDETGERTVSMTPHGTRWIERLQYLEEEGYLDDLIFSDCED